MALNWLIIVPVAICLFCLPELLWALSYGWPLGSPRSLSEWSPRVMYLAIGCVAVAAVFVAKRTWQPAYSSEIRNPGKHGSASWELCLFALPMVSGSWLIAETWLRRGVIGARHTFLEIAGKYFQYVLTPPLIMSLVRLRVFIYRLKEQRDTVPHKYSLDGYPEWFQRIRLGFAKSLSRVRQYHLVTAKAIKHGNWKPTVFHKHGKSGEISWPRLVWSFIAPGHSGRLDRAVAG